jgi:3-oxoacyl-[acyl-carrier protein] reductase
MQKSLFDLTGQVAVITGGGSGIGKSIAMYLALEGASVCIVGRNRDNLESTAQEIVNEGGKCLKVVANVQQADQIDNMVKETMEQLGRIDILVNNAGGNYTRDGSPPKRLIEELTPEEWDYILEVNLKSVFLVTRAVVPHMKKRNYGRIINVSSIVGRVGVPFITLPYSTAKAGILGFTRTLAHQLGPMGITVNTIAPGYILSSPRLEMIWEGRQKSGIADQVINSIPLKRLGKPEEVAAVVALLASDKASYVTGSIIDIFGGAFML